MSFKLPGQIFIALFIVLLVSSCATRFVFTSPDFKQGAGSTSNGDIKISYLHDNYLDSTGTRFQRKMQKAELWFIPIYIENHSEDTIQLSPENLLVFSGNLPVELIDDDPFIYKKLKQRPGWYALYILAGPWYYTGDSFQYYPVFPLIGAYNFIKAKNANSTLKNDFVNKNILGKAIAPHDSLDGWISIRSNEPVDLYVRFMEDGKE